MANEIQLPSSTGKTITAQLYLGNAAVGSPISLSEIGSSGVYVGSVPGGTAKGNYLVVAISNSVNIASGMLSWNGEQEVTPIMYNEMWQIGGFDANNPATNTPTSRIAADVDLDVAGYGTSTTVVTRQ